MKDIKISKGLDLPIGGAAARQVIDARSISSYAVKPTDVVGFTPKLLVAEGDAVVAGQPLLADKNNSRLILPSPVCGKVEKIVRGEKRKLLAVVVSKSNLTTQPTNEESRHLSPESPVWWMLRERPFGIIANPDHKPKTIFISMYDSNPLAPEYDIALQGKAHELNIALEHLAEIAPVHICFKKDSFSFDLPTDHDNISVHYFSGPHPAGNVGTQIAAISPINKGEYVWTIGAQDAACIGHWLATGEYLPERTVAVAGPAAKAPKYYRLLAGACVKEICQTQMINPSYPSIIEGETGKGTRIVSGSLLSGTQISPDGFLGMYDQQLCFIEEGDNYEFMGWLMPGLGKFSFSRTFLSGILHDILPQSVRGEIQMPHSFNTNMHGSVRPFLFTGSFERVFPFDIYPLQLIKACIVGDIELQEKLGIYEVMPEDFALCEFIDPSKTEIQSIISNALEVLRKEAMA